MFVHSSLPKCAQNKPHISNKINATIFATDRGWVAEHPNGHQEILTEAKGLLTKLTQLGYDKFGSLLEGDETVIEDVPSVAPMTYTYYTPLIAPVLTEGEEEVFTKEEIEKMEWVKLKALASDRNVEGRSRKELVEGMIKFFNL